MASKPLNEPRRSFIRGLALTGAAAFCMSPAESMALVARPGRRLKAQPAMTFLFQGDSITDGNRGRNNDKNHIMGHGYAFSIASRISADYPEKRFEFFNRGISGNKINDLASRWQRDTLELKPDVLSILVGINDASSVVFQRQPVISVEKYAEIYENLLQQARSQNPNITFVLCEPFMLPVGKVKENWDAYHADLSQRQPVVKELSQKFDAVFVGFQQVFDEACKKAPADYWIWDGVHPTIAGHELMAREWLKKTEQRLKFR